MISLEEYLGQHAQGHEDEVTKTLKLNARDLLTRVNALCQWAQMDPPLSSGWRPAGYNATVKGAAPQSTHITGEGIDLADHDRRFMTYCLDNLHLLAEFGLWLEDPRATPTWVHLQSRPPASGKRVFIPSADWAARLQDQPKHEL